jgi:hypothetical protein
MTPSPESHDKLERLIHRTLRDVPPRRAPHSLELRVLAEIERRAALPWWRRSFSHWPLAARAGFLVLCTALVKLALMLGSWIMSGFDPAQFRLSFTEQFAWMENAMAVVHAITGAFEVLFRNIPPLWLYGGLAFFATMYLALFGLGAAAYKALHAQVRR